MEHGAVKFAFWGRISTEDRQDPQSSRCWQLARSKRDALAVRAGLGLDRDYLGPPSSTCCRDSSAT